MILSYDNHFSGSLRPDFSERRGSYTMADPPKNEGHYNEREGRGYEKSSPEQQAGSEFVTLESTRSKPRDHCIVSSISIC
jgi:hypothetical protein